MSLAVVGSVALDTVETPWGRNDEGLGGAATYFSLAAANYCPVHLVGVVGDDFPEQHVQLLESKKIDLTGLERAKGKTFRWSGRYHDDVNERDTLETHLNVFEHFHPKLPPGAKSAEFLFLANIHPALQLEVLEQARAEFIGLDTMNLWIDIAREDLKRVLARVHVLVINDAEAKQLTEAQNEIRAAQMIRELGPEIVIIKKGEHGCLLFQQKNIFATPAFPLLDVNDPTGAGDSFAGGFMGYLAKCGDTDFGSLKKAVIHGSAVASFTCEQFGPDRLATVTMAEIEERYKAFKNLITF